MLTVAQLIERLRAYPPEANVYAYEGEVTGIVVVSGPPHTDGPPARPRQQFGIIEAYDGDRP